MKPADFLAELWGSKLPDGTLIQVWELERRRSSYYRAPIGTSGLKGRGDLYTCVALTHKDHGPRHRARADQAVAIAGLWLDIDINGGPDGKTGAAPNATVAGELAHHLLEPTLLINSGHGRQAWWLLDDGPWRFRTRDAQAQAALMAAQWHRLHQAAAAERGFQIDSTHDLARLMRLPGTINCKGGTQSPVWVIHVGPRHPLDRLRDLCAQAGPVLVADSTGDPATGGALPDVTVRDPRVDADRLQALIDNSHEFSSAWRHQRGRGWSMSEYDLSITTLAAQAGFTDQELADLIAHHRRLWNPSDPKITRVDYLRRTIAKARNAGQRTSAAARLAAAARRAA